MWIFWYGQLMWLKRRWYIHHHILMIKEKLNKAFVLVHFITQNVLVDSSLGNFKTLILITWWVKYWWDYILVTHIIQFLKALVIKIYHKDESYSHIPASSSSRILESIFPFFLGINQTSVLSLYFMSFVVAIYTFLTPGWISFNSFRTCRCNVFDK